MASDDPAARVGENIRKMLETLGTDEERARALAEANVCSHCGALGKWWHSCWRRRDPESWRRMPLTGAMTKG